MLIVPYATATRGNYSIKENPLKTFLKKISNAPLKILLYITIFINARIVI